MACDDRTRRARNLAYRRERSYVSTYRIGILHSPEAAANLMVCLIHQTNYLLDRQLASLERRFLDEGGFTERLYQARFSRRRQQHGSG